MGPAQGAQWPSDGLQNLIYEEPHVTGNGMARVSGWFEPTYDAVESHPTCDIHNNGKRRINEGSLIFVMNRYAAVFVLLQGTVQCDYLSSFHLIIILLLNLVY